MRVLVNGIPYFSRILVEDLNQLDPSNQYVFCDTYTTLWGKIKYIINVPFSTVVVSSNGVSDQSGSLKWALAWRKKMIMQWHGSDVMLAMKRMNEKTIDTTFIEASQHLISAPWFADELHGIVDNVTYAPISYADHFGNESTYRDFSIITYLVKGKEAFYGWEFVKKVAENNPTISIKVVGHNGEGLRAPENISFFGWIEQDKLLMLLEETPVLLRLTEHDGKSLMVSQALAVGCEVVWTCKMNYCHYFNGQQEQLNETLNVLLKKLETRKMKPNQQNIQFAKNHLSRDQVMRSFLSKLKTMMNGRS